MDKIVKEEHKFPNDIQISDICYKLINGLLHKSPKYRLEMSDPLFEEWYNDPGSDVPIIIVKANSHDTISIDGPKTDAKKPSSSKMTSTITYSGTKPTSISRPNSIPKKNPFIKAQTQSTLNINPRGSSKFIKPIENKK
jgi:hypothetical protein